MSTYEFPAGATLDFVAQRMVDIAQEQQDIVQIIFNDIPLTADVHSTVKDIIKSYATEWGKRNKKMPLSEEQLIIGDIMQITDPHHPWFPCLLIVTEVGIGWVLGYVGIPMSMNGRISPSAAFNRVRDEQITKVGHTILYRPVEEI